MTNYLKAVCDEQGRWWAVGTVTGEFYGGPFDNEQEIYEWMQAMPDEEDDGRDFTPPYEP